MTVRLFCIIAHAFLFEFIYREEVDVVEECLIAK